MCTSVLLTHTHTYRCALTALHASSPLNILPHLVDGTGTFPSFAGVGPVWLMGLNERGRDPSRELLPVSVEGVFRGDHRGSQRASGLRWCCHAGKHTSGEAELGESETPLFTALGASGSNTLTPWASDRSRHGAWRALTDSERQKWEFCDFFI